MRESTPPVPIRRLFAAAAVVLALVTAISVCAVAFFVVRPRFLRLGNLRDTTLLRVYLTDPRIRELAAALQEGDPRKDVLKTIWDTNQGVLLSRRMFRDVDMDGVPKYGYKPNISKLGFIIGAGESEWKIEALDTPRTRDALRAVEPKRLVTASYDEHGFRRVDPALTTGCALHVLFLGDSFTDGPWVDDSETFVNLYGRHARSRGVAACPVNAGVNGYGSFEERFVLEHEFDAAGRPSVVFVMYFPNDVDENYYAVIDGDLRDGDRLWGNSLNELARIRRFTAGHHGTMVLVAIPPAGQVIDRAPETHYQDRLRAFAEREGIMFVDLYAALIARDPRQLYWTWDPHFTPEGHRVTAELLYEATRELLQ